MAKTKPNVNTKLDILDSAKKLFYNKGYKNTHYNEIAQHANLSPGMLHYYFRTKKTLAGKIINDLSLDLHKQIKSIFEHKYDLNIIFILELIIYYDLLHTNKNFQKFYLDICDQNIINDYTKETTFIFVKLYYKVFNINIDKKYIKAYSTIFNFAQSGLFSQKLLGYLDLEYDKVVDLCIQLIFNYFGLKEDRIKVDIETARGECAKLRTTLKENFDIQITYKENGDEKSC